MHKAIRWGLLAVIVVAAVVVFAQTVAQQEREDVLVLCGGSMRQALEDCVERYKKNSDLTVTATYGGSGELAAQLRETGRGDLYIAHDPWAGWAEERDLITEYGTLAYVDLRIVVPKDNPQNITSLEDLTQDGIRLGVGDPEYSTSGVIFNHLLDNIPYGDEISKNIKKTGHGHQKRCTEVSMGSLDAGIVWNAAAHLFRDKLKSFPVPRESLDAVTSATFGKTDLANIRVTVAVTKPGSDNKAATDFYNFMLNECRDIFEKHGFRPVEE